MKSHTSKGFTLAELLVVVAIIGILVAVSIPIFAAQTKKAKAATDAANVRAAKAAALAQYMSDDMPETGTYYHDAASGTVTSDSTAAAGYKGYGKSTEAPTNPDDNADNIPNENGTAHIVEIDVDANGTKAKWVLGTSSGGGSGSTSPFDNYKSNSTWSACQASFTSPYYNSCTFPAGSIVSDNGVNYLFFSYTQNYDDATIKTSSLADYAKTQPTRIEVLNTAKVLTDADVTIGDGGTTLWKDTVKAGSVYKYNGVYYVAKEDLTGHSFPGNWQWAALTSGS